MGGKRVWDDCMSGEEGYWPPFLNTRKKRKRMKRRKRMRILTQIIARPSVLYSGKPSSAAWDRTLSLAGQAERSFGFGIGNETGHVDNWHRIIFSWMTGEKFLLLLMLSK